MGRGRPRKEVSPLEELEEVVVEESKDEQLAQLKKQIDSLQKIIEQLSSKKEETAPSYEDVFDSEKIPLDDYIKVVSLCPNKLNLSVLGMGKGRIFTFKSFGETKRILYSDLVQIIEHQDNFLRKGVFYIDDKRVIRRHGLDELYQTILTKEMIERIIKNSSDAISLFTNANDDQKKMIAQIFIDKLAAGEKIDLNFIDALSRASDIKIMEKAEDVRIFLSKDEEKVKS